MGSFSGASFSRGGRDGGNESRGRAQSRKTSLSYHASGCYALSVSSFLRRADAAASQLLWQTVSTYTSARSAGNKLQAAGISHPPPLLLLRIGALRVRAVTSILISVWRLAASINRPVPVLGADVEKRVLPPAMRPAIRLAPIGSSVLHDISSAPPGAGGGITSPPEAQRSFRRPLASPKHSTSATNVTGLARPTDRQIRETSARSVQ